MKTCAICGKPITFRFRLCKECEKTKNEPWSKAIQKIENHNDYVERYRNKYEKFHGAELDFDILREESIVKNFR
jgi:hypothetical protein